LLKDNREENFANQIPGKWKLNLHRYSQILSTFKCKNSNNTIWCNYYFRDYSRKSYYLSII